MLANYSKIVRRAGALTAVAAAIMVAVSAALVGVKGLIGALIGVAIVAVFFGISILVVGRAARVSPQAMMVAALASYLVKIVGLAVIVSRLNGTTAFSTKTLGFVAIGCILVWTGAQAVTAMKMKMLYVEPDSASPTSASPASASTASASAKPASAKPADTEPAEPEPHAARRGE
jgi:ATP synthase protein I